MGKTDGERLKRWRQNQKAKGRRHISFMLSLEATEALDKIQTETGESVAGVFDRLTQGTLPIAKKIVPDIKLDVISGIKDKISPEKQKVLDLIRTLREQHGLSHIQIAKYLNEEGIETFSGKGVHGQGQIGKLLKKMGVK